ncbi:hypothetical protein ATANTOWER_032691 [Ataeniobius toweri]|uniref:Secreted protein n=1 Tax=Ataeniobius toweri TaxID=208326 RepID=A0ABU7A400_9TELE|nr:hypothetical protein [Ataeniobius toweri]
MNLLIAPLAAPLAAPLVLAVRTCQQPTITQLPVHRPTLHHLLHIHLKERTRKSLPTNSTHHNLPISATVGMLAFLPWKSTISPAW